MYEGKGTEVTSYQDRDKLLRFLKGLFGMMVLLLNFRNHISYFFVSGLLSVGRSFVALIPGFDLFL